MVVAILGYNFQYSSPHRKEGLIWSLLWGSKECLSCCALQGELWYVDLIRVDGWSIHCSLDLYLRGCFNPLMLFLIFILPVWVDLHFVDKLVRYMSPSFFICIFPLFSIKYLLASAKRLELDTNLATISYVIYSSLIKKTDN